MNTIRRYMSAMNVEPPIVNNVERPIDILKQIGQTRYDIHITTQHLRKETTYMSNHMMHNEAVIDEMMNAEAETGSQGRARDPIADIPVWHKFILTIEEAARYYHIGETKIRMLVESNPTGNFYLMNGNRMLIKRAQFEQYLIQANAV